MLRVLYFFISLVLSTCFPMGHTGILADETKPVMDRQRIQFKSTADASEQEAILILPKSTKDSSKVVPMVVSLHSWSGDLKQRNALECDESVYSDESKRGRKQDDDERASLIVIRLIVGERDLGTGRQILDRKQSKPLLPIGRGLRIDLDPQPPRKEVGGD